MDKRRKLLIEENEISEIFEWDLGGYKQKVLVEGKKRENPVVITLHGGPGTPIPFSVGCRGLFPAFTDEFVMVYWDQLGCGINDRIIDDSFHIDNFADMTLDLIHKIKNVFPENKIYIFAMSWGSILSAKLLEKETCPVDGVVVYGQIIKDTFFNDEVMTALEKSSISPKKLNMIRNATKQSAAPKELQLISSSIRKYTSGYTNKNGEQAPVIGIIKGLLTSPDYKIKDIKAMVINGYRKNRSLWKEILLLDLSNLLCSAQIPYMMLQGDTDIVASTREVQKLVNTCNNPNLTYEIIGNSGHMPGKEGMEKVLNVLKKLKSEV